MSYGEMGRVVKEEVWSYQGDAIRDGVYIARLGENQDFIWMVRSTGTDIAHIGSLYVEVLREVSRDRAHRNERFFLVGRFDTDEEYFVEITREDVLSIIDVAEEAAARAEPVAK